MEETSDSDYKQYVGRSNKVMDQFPDMDANSVRSKLINPLLELLGWDLGFDARIDSEIDVGSNSYTMDYVLMGDSDPDVLLCVKPLEETLTGSNSDFMESCLESSVATLGMITNGKNFELYQAEDDVRKLGVAKIDRLRDSNNIVNLLSKSNVRSVLYVSARKFIQ